MFEREQSLLTKNVRSISIPNLKIKNTAFKLKTESLTDEWF